MMIVLWCTIVLHWLTATDDGNSSLVGAGATGSHSRSRHRSHRPQLSAIASYAKPRSSSEIDIDPSGIRREIRITQAVESAELVEIDDIDGRKSAIGITTQEL
jgi:hypothetical protein